jgi:Protein of unknown function (DUF1286)
MKEITHYVFSTGASFAVLSFGRQLTPATILMALWLSLSINYLIDVLGHFSKNGKPTRTWFTHSVITAPFWGALVAAASLIVVANIRLSFTFAEDTWFWLSVGVLVSAEHLLLDSLTQAGVYSLKGRIAIAHFRYDNVALNLGFALLGVLLIVISLEA